MSWGSRVSPCLHLYFAVVVTVLPWDVGEVSLLPSDVALDKELQSSDASCSCSVGNGPIMEAGVYLCTALFS